MRKKSIRVMDAAEILGVSGTTIRRWTNEGKIPYKLNAAKQRIYEIEDLEKLKPDYNENIQEKKIAFYIRSSTGQEASITTQQNILTENYGTPTITAIDKCSGLKEDRPGLNKLFKAAENGEITDIYATYPDRLSRFGKKYIEKIFNIYKVQVHYLDKNDKTPYEELLQDFMNLLASFSGKFYRLRGWEQQKQLLKTAQENIKQKEDKKNDRTTS